jgi:hypothetical protein
MLNAGKRGMTDDGIVVARDGSHTKVLGKAAEAS